MIGATGDRLASEEAAAYFYADFRRLPQDRVMVYWATNEFDKVSEEVTHRLIRMALGSK